MQIPMTTPVKTDRNGTRHTDASLNAYSGNLHSTMDKIMESVAKMHSESMQLQRMQRSYRYSALTWYTGTNTSSIHKQSVNAITTCRIECSNRRKPQVYRYLRDQHGYDHNEYHCVIRFKTSDRFFQDVIPHDRWKMVAWMQMNRTI